MSDHPSHNISSLLFISLFALKTLILSSGSSNAQNQSRISAVFVFGDSTVDPGNNNFLVTDAKSNFPPYGCDFVGSQPTGRFSDGRLVTDFIASYIGVKDYIPPYLDPTLGLDELKTGVSFASAATGFDPLTASLTNVLPILSQLNNFREYKSKMETAVGKTETDTILRNSVIIISAGTNDFVLNYLSLPVRSQHYTVSEYQQYLLCQLEQLVQALIDEGVRKIGVVGLPPIGCLPMAITLFSNDHNLFTGHECIESLSVIGKTYNEMLQNKLSSKRYELNGVKVAYGDIYNPVISIVQNPKKFGFQEVFRGCCGTGIIEVSVLCNPALPLCSDVSEYVFFDAIHPTEKIGSRKVVTCGWIRKLEGMREKLNFIDNIIIHAHAYNAFCWYLQYFNRKGIRTRWSILSP